MMPSTNRFLVALIVGFAISPLVQAQLKTFKPGDVIKSSETNENFEYLEEQIGSAGDAASAQCSATQDGNSAVISCTDGSSAMLAGAGTVVIYPAGKLSPGDPIIYPTGDIVLMDGNDVVLGKASSVDFSDISFVVTVTEAGEGLAVTNLVDSQQVVVSGSLSANDHLYFREIDCAGDPFKESFSRGLTEIDGIFYAWTPEVRSTELLMKSRRQGRWIDRTTGANRAAGDCENGAYTIAAVPAAVFTLPPEILYAAYSVRLEQLP